MAPCCLGVSPTWPLVSVRKSHLTDGETSHDEPGQEHVDPLNRLHRVPLSRTKEAQDQSATKNYE